MAMDIKVRGSYGDHMWADFTVESIVEDGVREYCSYAKTLEDCLWRCLVEMATKAFEAEKGLDIEKYEELELKTIDPPSDEEGRTRVYELLAKAQDIKKQSSR